MSGRFLDNFDRYQRRHISVNANEYEIEFIEIYQKSKLFYWWQLQEDFNILEVQLAKSVEIPDRISAEG